MSSSQEQEIINEIIESITLSKPKTMVAVNEIIKSLRKNDATSAYSLLVGEIQAGKTPAQMILIWLWARSPEFMGNVCFITKSLDSIRRDIMGKFKSGLINDHIIAVCAKHGIDSGKALKRFGITYNTYRGGKAITIKPGQVEIMLMQKDNLAHIRQWYRATTEPILVVMDEVHEMYSGCKQMVKNSGLTENSHANISMLHWLHSKSQKSDKRLYLVGVTATPYAPMTADPICYPTNVISLQTDAPAPGLDYFGYENNRLKPNVKINTFKMEGNSVSSTIGHILNEPRNVLKNGMTEVCVVCVTYERLNDAHSSIARSIKSEYGSRVHVLEFNQLNSTNLNSWFKEEMLTEEVCLSGALVIIGQACMAAGITIKPSKPMIREFNGKIYTVSGITDQLMPSRDINVTATKQLMRLLGWFPEGHRSNMWVECDEHHTMYRTELGEVHTQFMKKYDPQVGPESVAHIKLRDNDDGLKVKHFHTNDMFSGGGRKGAVEVQVSEQVTEGLTLLETKRVSFTPEQKAMISKHEYSDVTIGFFYAGGHDSEKLGHQAMLKHILGFKAGSHVFIGYTQERTDQIMRAVLKTKAKDAKTEGLKVNGFLWGDKGIDSKISDCYVVLFDKPWYTRPTKDVCFERAPGEFVSLVPSKSNVKTHQYVQEFAELTENGCSQEHVDTLTEMDSVPPAMVRKMNAWILFQTCHKIVRGTGSAVVCSPLYKILKAKFGNIVITFSQNENKITEGCKLLRASCS